MDTKTNDADTEWNTVTVAGPHALLTLAESLTWCMYSNTKSFYSKHNIIADAHIEFYFCFVKFKTGPANPSINKFNWFGLIVSILDVPELIALF